MMDKRAETMANEQSLLLFPDLSLHGMNGDDERERERETERQSAATNPATIISQGRL